MEFLSGVAREIEKSPRPHTHTFKVLSRQCRVYYIIANPLRAVIAILWELSAPKGWRLVLGLVVTVVYVS